MKTPEEIKKGLERCRLDDSCENGCPYHHEGCGDEMRKDALTYIKALEAAQPKWISVRDRLPEDFCEVLIVLHGKCVNIAWHHGEGVFEVPSGIRFHTTKDNKMLTHWMPLPKPPKEEDHENA